MEIDKEVLKGYIDIMLLSILAEGPFYGYELAKRVRERSQDLFEIKEGTMYLALKRMEGNKLVRSFWGDEASEGGRRKYYEILPLGSERYQHKKKEWDFLKKIMDNFLGGSL